MTTIVTFPDSSAAAEWAALSPTRGWAIADLTDSTPEAVRAAVAAAYEAEEGQDAPAFDLAEAIEAAARVMERAGIAADEGLEFTAILVFGYEREDPCPAEYRWMREAAKARGAGSYEEQMRDAGRGHLAGVR